MKIAIYEVPISYYGRTYDEGKKITFADGLVAFLAAEHRQIDPLGD